ncbi:MAG: glycoside hydrolase family 16 protein [Balneolaceae bacterium]|nr:glycoside hydrolase family 16 protein [Balneolaceae bacterium]MBO6547176.1 glycoside hydrolase family 16 protein [Balneolaceae bacterium]MBO6647876.1 glycoside hydrolase family 16 protein [Balneolaceae bacterium]
MLLHKTLSLLIVFLFLIAACNEPRQTEYDFSKWDSAELVWSDEFDGIEVDTTKWLFEEGAHGWGNREWQNYQSFGSDNATVEDGVLSITAKLVGEGQNVGDYTSARLNSKEAFLYGRMEIKAKMPDHKGNGVWPALWMLGEPFRNGGGWPRSGEIDIMEYVSYRPDSTLVTIHTTANNHVDGTQVSSDFVALPTIEEEFHKFGILWEEDVLHFYIDEIDNILLTFNRPTIHNQKNWPFDNPFYFLMNIAVGGNLGGVKGVDDSIFPSTMHVDYVRVWQLSDKN